MMKKALLLTTLCLLAVSSAMAVPSLQLWIDPLSADVVYDDISETWVTASSDFDIWVIASHLDKGSLFEVGLIAALGEGVATNSGSLTITPDGGSGTTYTGTGGATGFQWGTPPPADPIPPHGIYPANYIVHDVAAQTPTNPGDWETVQDYIPGSDGGEDIHGFIYKFNVSTTYASIHFDAFGFYETENGKRKFAPFSHDAEIVPEPTTMVLLGFGLFGAGIARRKKK